MNCLSDDPSDVRPARSPRSRLPSRFRPMALLVISGLLGLAAPARADFFMSIGDYQQTSPTSGSFEVYLTNTDATTYDVAGFSFELSLVSTSGVQFTDVSTETLGRTTSSTAAGRPLSTPTSSSPRRRSRTPTSLRRTPSSPTRASRSPPAPRSAWAW